MFAVTLTLQSQGNPPVTMTYARAVTGGRAIVAAGQALLDHDDHDDNVPAALRPRVVSVTITPEA